jgi:hypothetical protein
VAPPGKLLCPEPRHRVALCVCSHFYETVSPFSYGQNLKGVKYNIFKLYKNKALTVVESKNS